MKRIERIHEKFINLMTEMATMEDKEELNRQFKRVYTKYCKFCYQHKINDRDAQEYLSELYKDLFILPSTPILHEIENDKLNEIIDKLEKILVNKNQDGLTIKDANTFLKAVVMGVRNAFSRDTDIINDSLIGKCGLGQAISFFLLDNLGIKTTLNNAVIFPDSKIQHAFLTCFLPIKDESGITYKQYLIDTTYRQFFKTINCNDGNFYSCDERFMEEASPNPGYYMSNFKDSKKMSIELLKNGFIELTKENAKMYGSGFSFCSIILSTSKKDIQRITSHSGDEYLNTINDNSLQVKVDYIKEEMEEFGINVDLRNIFKGNSK